MQGSVNIVDATTAQTLGMKTIEGRGEKSNRSEHGIPEAPSADEGYLNKSLMAKQADITGDAIALANRMIASQQG